MHTFHSRWGIFRNMPNPLEGQWPVVHIIGHGGFDAACGEGTLAFVGENGSPDWVGSEPVGGFVQAGAADTPSRGPQLLCWRLHRDRGPVLRNSSNVSARGAVVAMQYGSQTQMRLRFHAASGMQ